MRSGLTAPVGDEMDALYTSFIFVQCYLMENIHTSCNFELTPGNPENAILLHFKIFAFHIAMDPELLHIYFDIFTPLIVHTWYIIA